MKRIQSINPFTEKLNAEFDYFSKSKALERIKKSRSAFSDWEELSPSSRGSFFRKLSDVLDKKKRNIAEKITQEMGKPISQALTEIERCMNICTYFADHAEELTKDEIVSTNLKKSYVAFQPLGIILGIMPWNYPIIQTFRFAIPTLLAGNVVVLKPASNVPLCGLAIEESFRETGFPEGVFQTLLIDASTATDLIREDIVNGVSLTGSFEAGSQVASAAGSRIKKVVLELGGSDPFIVLEDANVEAVAKIAAQTRFVNCGQSCVAAKRFLVMDSIAEKFAEAFIQEMNQYRIGDPMDENTGMGPLYSRKGIEELRQQVEDARAKGAEIIEGPPIPERGAFFRPVVIRYANRDMRVAREETFGPIAPIFRISNEKELLELANDTEFGLGATVWTGDVERGERLARRIRAGFVGVNQIVRSDPRLPFGGTKMSGIGRELSYFGVREFTNIKTVVLENQK